MPTYDGIGTSSITHRVEVVGDSIFQDVDGGTLSTKVPVQIFSNYTSSPDSVESSRQLRFRVQPENESNVSNSYVTDMGIKGADGSNYFFVTAPQNTSNVGDQNTFVIATTSNVGIGTTNPEATLQVVGDIKCQTLTATTITGGSPLTISATSISIEAPVAMAADVPMSIGTMTVSNIFHSDQLTMSANVFVTEGSVLTLSKIFHTDTVTMSAHIAMDSDKTLTTSNIETSNLSVSNRLSGGTISVSNIEATANLVVGGPVDITGTLSAAGITSSADVNVTGTITTSNIVAHTNENLTVSSNLEVGNMSVTGSIINPELQQASTDIDTLQTKTTNISYASGTTSVAGTLSASIYANLPNFDASKITTGELAKERIPLTLRTGTVIDGGTGDSRLYIKADSNNNGGTGEYDNPKIIFIQDGTYYEGLIGLNNLNELEIRNSVGSGAGISFWCGTTDGNGIETALDTATKVGIFTPTGLSITGTLNAGNTTLGTLNAGNTTLGTLNAGRMEVAVGSEGSYIARFRNTSTGSDQDARVVIETSDDGGEAQLIFRTTNQTASYNLWHIMAGQGLTPDLSFQYGTDYNAGTTAMTIKHGGNVTGTTFTTGSLNGTGSVINCNSVFFPKRSVGPTDGLAMYLDSGYYVVPAGTYYAWGGYPGIVLTGSASGEFRYHGWGSLTLLVRSDGGFIPFTGLHISFVKFSDDDIGKIVSSTGEYCTEFGNDSYLNELNILDAFPIVKITTKSKDKSVFGVLSSNHSLEGKFQYAYINSIGEGGIWVCNKNGNFENGDYITSSDVRGYGMKQDVEYLANYTVAKITSDCDFTKIIQTKRKVKRNGHIYEYNGNEPVYEDVLDEHGNSIQEQKFKLRYLLEDGTETTEENAVYIAAFVGCTYHCG